MNDETFIKLMGMTTSSFDQEALVALRKANAMLMADNLTWREFLEKKGTKVVYVNTAAAPPPPPKARRYSDPDEIDELFDAVFTQTNSVSFTAFLNSIHEWWQEKNFLTEKQYDALRRAAGR